MPSTDAEQTNPRGFLHTRLGTILVWIIFICGLSLLTGFVGFRLGMAVGQQSKPHYLGSAKY